jgi:hypothetical protein
MNQASKKGFPLSVDADVSGIETLLNLIFRKFSAKMIRLVEGPQFSNFTPKSVCGACRPALSSVTTHWTSSPAISEGRIPLCLYPSWRAPGSAQFGTPAVGSGPNGEAPRYSGVDFIIARDGKIAALYVYLDSPPT